MHPWVENTNRDRGERELSGRNRQTAILQLLAPTCSDARDPAALSRDARSLGLALLIVNSLAKSSTLQSPMLPIPPKPHGSLVLYLFLLKLWQHQHGNRLTRPFKSSSGRQVVITLTPSPAGPSAELSAGPQHRMSCICRKSQADGRCCST